ncbi:PREDICTED: RNA-directed DNA polymerase from mobile element jockey-like [Cyphomyrmex costatus]|uniref:RNA-directed DNA polymerase from mobile element jockey-like n=1 Tax=Cyphomyrmex costatus TaxID=456900 RepID=UPI0008523405|nr:PREDICTED: RNA-directed DNA polymerase from mobile element jockey-like [Cyphomyrmex costatus]
MHSLRSIKIAYWNCRGALGKKGDIEKLAETVDILFLAETCVGPLCNFRVLGFDCLRVDANRADVRGMLILIRNPILYSPVDLSGIFNNSFEALGIELSLNSSRLLLIGTYRHPSAPAPANSLSALSSLLDKQELFILLGDFNAHHPMWGGSRANAAGHLLANLIDDHHLVVLNPPSSPTHVSFSPFSLSTIDLAIASPRISSLCDTQVSPDLLGSDHYPLEVNCGVRTASVFAYKINLSKDQWSAVQHYLSVNANSISQSICDIDPDDPVSQYNTFMELVSKSYEDFSLSKPLPTSSNSRAAFTKKGPPPSPWWTPDCSVAIDQRREALKTFKRFPTWDNYVFYRSVVSQTRKVLRKAKRAGWRRYCGSLDMKTPTADIWRMLKRFRNRRLIPANSPAQNSNEDRSVMIREAIENFVLLRFVLLRFLLLLLAFQSLTMAAMHGWMILLLPMSYLPLFNRSNPPLVRG